MTRSQPFAAHPHARDIVRGAEREDLREYVVGVLGVFDAHVERVAVLHFGHLLAIDSPEAVMADPTVQSAYLGESA